MSSGAQSGRSEGLSRDGQPGLVAWLALLLLRAYRALLSPWLAPACRFEPSCSCYAELSIERHGVLRGGVLALRRLGRCHPLGGSGYDPVP